MVIGSPWVSSRIWDWVLVLMVDSMFRKTIESGEIDMAWRLVSERTVSATEESFGKKSKQ